MAYRHMERQIKRIKEELKEEIEEKITVLDMNLIENASSTTPFMNTLFSPFETEFFDYITQGTGVNQRTGNQILVKKIRIYISEYNLQQPSTENPSGGGYSYDPTPTRYQYRWTYGYKKDNKDINVDINQLYPSGAFGVSGAFYPSVPYDYLNVNWDNWVIKKVEQGSKSMNDRGGGTYNWIEEFDFGFGLKVVYDDNNASPIRNQFFMWCQQDNNNNTPQAQAARFIKAVVWFTDA